MLPVPKNCAPRSCYVTVGTWIWTRCRRQSQLPAPDFRQPVRSSMGTCEEMVFIGATRAEATRLADDWWAHQKGGAPQWLLAKRDQTRSLINGP
jgi:hypothetical protein